MNYIFELKTADPKTGWLGSKRTESFNEVLEYTKNYKDFGIMEVKEVTEGIRIWSSPDGFVSQSVFLQGCKTTDESLEKLKTYERDKNTLIVDLINKYCV